MCVADGGGKSMRNGSCFSLMRIRESRFVFTGSRSLCFLPHELRGREFRAQDTYDVSIMLIMCMTHINCYVKKMKISQRVPEELYVRITIS